MAKEKGEVKEEEGEPKEAKDEEEEEEEEGDDPHAKTGKPVVIRPPAHNARDSANWYPINRNWRGLD